MVPGLVKAGIVRGTISRVRSLISGWIIFASTIRVSRFTSTKTGVAPHNWIWLAVDTQVIEGVITSSPGPISIALMKRCMPAVADDSATAYRAPVISHTSCSNSAFLAPVVIQPERNTSATAAISSSDIDGFDRGIKGLFTDDSFLIDLTHQHIVSY